MPIEPLIYAITALAALAMAATALLKAWHGWLALRRSELEMSAIPIGGERSGAGSRIELANLKERIRRLEAIAAGVDL